MKTSLRLCFLGALALAGLVACNKEVRENNPNYNPETGEVNTKFVFNLSSMAKTKQAGNNVQAGGNNFRGVTKASLMRLIFLLFQVLLLQCHQRLMKQNIFMMNHSTTTDHSLLDFQGL